ncbi:MAG TPA: glycosyltransferase [Saprospiraceae bacterium]|nr:glycosyltransferase [Saprospiraceae bacterium]
MKLDALPAKFYKERSQTRFSTSWVSSYNIVNKINELNPDIVHFHWVGDGMIKIEDYKKIKAPIVWSLHDMWPFTGGCHYDDECNAYTNCCGKCKVLKSNVDNDVSRKVFMRKLQHFPEINNMTIVGLSNWLKDCAQKSPLLKNRNILNLPNPIDIKIFNKKDPINSRSYFSLPKDKKLILFGAMRTTSVPRKGFKELKQALKNLNDQNIELVVIGSDKPETPENLGYDVHYLGHINSDEELAMIYSAVDILLVPSLQENLSNAIMESMACSTPVIAFNIGGNSDMIEHKKNGYLSKPFDTQDFADGISWVLEHNQHNQLGNRARDKVTNNFESKIVAKKYISLYKEILNER